MWDGCLTRPQFTKDGQDFGMSGTSLRESAPTTTLSTSQSNAAHPTRVLVKLFWQSADRTAERQISQ
ncbi:MAG: hypothetical protein ACYTX0_54075, partial [Nostoc sp.]